MAPVADDIGSVCRLWIGQANVWIMYIGRMKFELHCQQASIFNELVGILNNRALILKRKVHVRVIRWTQRIYVSSSCCKLLHLILCKLLLILYWQHFVANIGLANYRKAKQFSFYHVSLFKTTFDGFSFILHDFNEVHVLDVCGRTFFSIKHLSDSWRIIKIICDYCVISRAMLFIVEW